MGVSPLYSAAQEGHLCVVKLLVNKGADLKQATVYGDTPLDQAALEGHQDVVDYLVSKGAEIEARGTPARACKFCGASEVTLMKCERCGTVYYCSSSCQRRDWKEGGESRHKIQCERLIETRARHAEKTKGEVNELVAEWGPSSDSVSYSVDLN